MSEKGFELLSLFFIFVSLGLVDFHLSLQQCLISLTVSNSSKIKTLTKKL